MSQVALTYAASPLTGTAMLTATQNMLASLASSRSGTSRPADAVAGEVWLNTTTATAWALTMYDGTHDIVFGYFNSSTGVYSAVPGQLPAVAAGGTVAAITAAFSPAVTLTDKMMVTVVAGGANATATPTFAPNGLTARTIVKRGGQPLLPGDIPGAYAVAYLMYDLANTRWELLNPATVQEPWAVAGGSANALTLTLAPAVPALYDGLCVSFRAAYANTTTTPTLNVNGRGAQTITKKGGRALAAGDIPRALYECICVYNRANTRWELLNPENPTTLLTDVHAVRTKAHPCTKSAVTDNSLTPDLTTAETFDWTPTGAATLNAPTVVGAGTWAVRYNYTSGPTLPKATYDGSAWIATGDILLVIGFGAADYELIWLNKA